MPLQRVSAASLKRGEPPSAAFCFEREVECDLAGRLSVGLKDSLESRRGGEKDEHSFSLIDQHRLLLFAEKKKKKRKKKLKVSR